MISQSPYPFDPRVRRQAEKLASAGFEVDILCLPLEDEPETEKFGERITAYRVLKKNTGQESIKKYLWVSATFFISGFLKLQKLNRIRKYRLIQIHNMPEVHVFTTVLQKMKGIPVLLDIHDLTPELLTSKWNNLFSRVVKPLTIFFEKISCRFSDHIITVTEGCKEILANRSTTADKITLILNTANTSTFPLFKERIFKNISKHAKLLYHGTVAERFGLHIIIDAMPLVLQRIPDSVLHVYGKYDADYKLFLEQKISELKLENNVFLEGARTHEELYEIMKDSDIEVVPYLNNEYMNLSLSTKVFECAASGLPIIATRLKTLGETFDNKAVKYVNDGDPVDFSDKIVEMCSNPFEREQMVLNAYNAITRISGDVMEERYLNLVEKMTGLLRIKPEVIAVENMSING